VHDLGPLIAQYGLGFVFANVLLEQLGLPIPALPTLVLAGAAAAEGRLSLVALFLAAVAASTVGDLSWYLAGRIFGSRVMALLCRISVSPDSCVHQTELRFERWGGLTLVAGKFIPGLATIGPPLAGAMRVGWRTFFALNTLGAALWAGAGLAAGVLFRAQVGSLLERLGDLGARAVVPVGSILAAYIALKWWERQRFYKVLRLARITAEELRQLMRDDADTVVVDVRSTVARHADPRFIPGALVLDDTGVRERIDGLPADRELVFYCSCPNEASAASVAKGLMARGYRRVRPLLGGLDAWIAAGYDIEVRSPEANTWSIGR
jgi:membrane protein DedA with SNARE-associated domain/rhodanese-related sulfurtransferase